MTVQWNDLIQTVPNKVLPLTKHTLKTWTTCMDGKIPLITESRWIYKTCKYDSVSWGKSCWLKHCGNETIETFFMRHIKTKRKAEEKEGRLTGRTCLWNVLVSPVIWKKHSCQPDDKSYDTVCSYSIHVSDVTKPDYGWRW